MRYVSELGSGLSQGEVQTPCQSPLRSRTSSVTGTGASMWTTTAVAVVGACAAAASVGCAEAAWVARSALRVRPVCPGFTVHLRRCCAKVGRGYGGPLRSPRSRVKTYVVVSSLPSGAR